MLLKMDTIETFEIDKLEVERIRLNPKFNKYYFKCKGGKALIELDGEMFMHSRHHVSQRSMEIISNTNTETPKDT